MILDWNEYTETAREIAAEGIVLLRNNNQVLPLKRGSNVAVFGRIQTHYYKSGTGSGGMVNVSKVIGILDALLQCPDIQVNQKLLDTYTAWESENPFNVGIGWGNEPWSQTEMPLDEDLLEEVATASDTAIIIIGRTAGEERDNRNAPGAYLLSDGEEAMLQKVRATFSKVIVLLNVGNIIDTSFVDKHQPDSVLYVWQGGMVGGLGVLDVLTGAVNPSGKLPDTIAKNITDFPSDPYFGDPVRNIYAEDIYVGYRYFETVAPEKVLFPFGFGLSYTRFQLEIQGLETVSEDVIWVRVKVKNVGPVAGKEVVQVYVEAPQGLMGKPLRSLVAFQKTDLLQPEEEQLLTLSFSKYDFASYDDAGITGNMSCYVLEKGDYVFHIGTSVRDTMSIPGLSVKETEVVSHLTQALAPDTAFSRMRPVQNALGGYSIDFEPTPLSGTEETLRRLANLPDEIEYTGDKGYKLADVYRGSVSLTDFVAQMTDHDLVSIIRGEGMGSPKVTPGTASAFGGVSPHLNELGIPCACCADGPSGMRIDTGTKAFSIPNGTLIASTFNTDLTEKLFEYLGYEMEKNKVDALLGPGMNIHRHPLNGRNFEYFSEDPVLTGKLACAELRGMRKAGVTGTLKHFCGNNQETNRHDIDSVISERALREIYLKGFEIAVTEGKASSVMTTYGAVNGVWTAGRYDLNTTILRQEWGFSGVVMTDWWANINEKGNPPTKTNFAAMVRSQNDLYMVCSDSSTNSMGENTEQALHDGRLTRAELQRSAMNVCTFLLGNAAFKRMIGESIPVEIINRQADEEDIAPEDVVYYPVEDGSEISFEHIDTSKGASYTFALDVQQFGAYQFQLAAKSDLGELAQLPVTIFCRSTPMAVLTFNGTAGQWATKQGKILLATKYMMLRIYFGADGLKLGNLTFSYEREIGPDFDPTGYII